MTSGITGVLKFALESLSLQTDTAANDIANSETPGYTAQEVSFEHSLSQALSSPFGGTAAASTYSSPALPASNGNNVNLTGELVDLQKSTLQSQTLVDLMNAQFNMERDAMQPPIY